MSARRSGAAWTAMALATALALPLPAGLRAQHDHGTPAPRATPVADPGAAAAKQLWTCGMHPEIIRDEPGICPICHMKLTPLVADGQAAGGAVVIDPVVVQNMGVRVAEVRRGDLTRRVRATGYLDQAEPRIHDVSLRVSGWIEVLHADVVGMHLEAGAPLFELYSPELQVAVDELIASRRGTAGAAGDGAGVTLLRAARRKLERYGLGAREIDRLAARDRAPRTVTFTSPITGHVTEKTVVAGSAVRAGDRILQIVDHSVLWLDLQVHPQDLPWVALGSTVTATVEGAAAPVRGEVFFVHPHVDPDTRTATVRVRIANPELVLRPGMYATAEMDATVARDALVVPREAVIDTGRRRIAFVALTGGRFEPRELETGERSDDGLVAVTRGLAAGERVVTSGQFLIDAESRMQEAVRKYLDAGLAPETP